MQRVPEPGDLLVCLNADGFRGAHLTKNKIYPCSFVNNLWCVIDDRNKVVYPAGARFEILEYKKIRYVKYD